MAGSFNLFRSSGTLLGRVISVPDPIKAEKLSYPSRGVHRRDTQTK